MESMEYDGNYPEELEWDLKDLPPNIQDIQYPHYNGNGPCLRNNVSRCFDTILGACGFAGGMTYELIKRITANSNAYTKVRRERHFIVEI